ncbi:MAG: FAD-binding oxidoreductase [Planctomycetota bacterium]
MNSSPTRRAPRARPLATYPQRVLSGFGMAQHAVCRYAAPAGSEELADLLARASAEGMPVALRGTGNSYGDAITNEHRLVIEMTRLNQLLHFDRDEGVVDVEPGFTYQNLWELSIPNGFWPAVVPGTMKPTLAGCAAMNIHGKNNFKAGPIGDYILEFDLVTSAGHKLTCSRTENADIFHAAIGGLGMLGVFTRLRLQLRKVESGLLRVEGPLAHNLEEMFSIFEERLPRSDYLVGWIDGLASGRALGRGVIHQANYITAAEDPEGPEQTLRVERQGLPNRLFGVPRGLLWRALRPFTNNAGMRLINTAKYWAGRQEARRGSYLQSHVQFAFLLDYIPNWKYAYGPGGFIQYQPFVPKERACEVFRELLTLCQRKGMPPYLVVLKRHRPDPFLLTHGLDGYSLAMDIRVHGWGRERVWALASQLTERVLEAGGKFYFAKDAVIGPEDARRAFGRDRLEAFATLKRRLDPHNLFQSDLSRRVFGELFGSRR